MLKAVVAENAIVSDKCLPLDTCYNSRINPAQENEAYRETDNGNHSESQIQRDRREDHDKSVSRCCETSEQPSIRDR
jgi:hypothetical protein